MSHTKSLFRLLSLLLLASLVMSACGLVSKKDKTKDTSPIIIGYNQWAGYGAINIADQKGFFAAEGVKVQVVSYSTYNTPFDDIVAKKIDGVPAVFTDVLSISAEKTPLEVVWVTDMSAGGDMVVGSSSLSGPADLKGKKVGFATGTFGELFVREGLKKYGLSEADITPVNLPAEQIPAALLSGQIDAGHTWDPYASQAIKDGAKVLFTSTDTPGVIAGVLCFRSDVVKNRPDDVRAIVRALGKAMDFWQQNPTEGNRITALFNGIAETDIAGALSGTQVFTLQDNRVILDRASTDPRSLYKSGAIIVDFLLTQGTIKNSPDLNSIINPTFLQG